MPSRSHYGAIHALKKVVGLEDADYRDLMVHHTGKSSSKQLSEAEAERFIVVLRGLDGRARTAPRRDRATGRYAPVLQAFWLSGVHLGLITDPSDRAMMRFVERQTGLPHTRFLVDQADARRAIEALKGWLGRAGVRWAAWEDTARGRKMAVLEAIAIASVKAGIFTAFVNPAASPWPAEFEAYGASRGLPERFAAYSEPEIIKLTRWLGERLRAAQSRHRKGGAHVEH